MLSLRANGIEATADSFHILYEKVFLSVRYKFIEYSARYFRLKV